MRKVFVRLLAILAVATFVTGAVTKVNAGAREYPQQDRANTITVCGEARVRYRNDTAIIHIGVETNHKNSSEALKVNSEKMSAVVAAIKSKGITEAEIGTSNISIFPRYEYVYGSSILKDYTAQNMIKVRTQRLEILGEILAVAGEAGANQMNGIEFLISNAEVLKSEATGQAVKNAEFKARIAAGSAGMPLGSVVSIREKGTTASAVNACDSAAVYKSSGVSAVPAISGDGEIYACVEVIYNFY